MTDKVSGGEWPCISLDQYLISSLLLAPLPALISASWGQSQAGDFHNANQGQPLSAQALIPWLRRSWQRMPRTPDPAHPQTLCDLARGGILQRAVLMALLAVIKLSFPL